ncbi:hypothetical protein [Arthrobacter sp. UM1]|uniref:hypothetical protein n=1 Tax=Arthrobacter sp. UM1 TaxID=2766776 RepID=UPI001CF6B09A|nr:hypothetical protein [Arthrobacter sp. UM1]MCB4209103.1 hypothetical protein [Arthrobacter sp. UM1]
MAPGSSLLDLFSGPTPKGPLPLDSAAVRYAGPGGLEVRGGPSQIYVVWEELSRVIEELRSMEEGLVQTARRAGELGGRAADAAWTGEAPFRESLALSEALRRVSVRAGAWVRESESLRAATAAAWEAYEAAEASVVRGLGRGFWGGPPGEFGRDETERAFELLVGAPGLLPLLTGQRWFRERQRPVAVLDDGVPAPDPRAPGTGTARYLADGIALSKQHAERFEARGRSAVLVESIVGSDGERVLVAYLPGSADLSDFASNNPNGVLGLGDALLGGSSAIASGVLGALDRAGMRPGDRVLLAGHSQGGMHASNLASSERFRERVRVAGLFTVGSPAGTARPLPGVAALHVEHRGDPVPGLEGARNPIGPGRVTVTLPAVPAEGGSERGGGPASRGRGGLEDHHLSAYQRSAERVDAEEGSRGLLQVRGELQGLLRTDDPGTRRTLTVFEIGQDRAAAPPHAAWEWAGPAGHPEWSGPGTRTREEHRSGG